MITYAIGDIHGCLASLRALLAKIEAHAAGRPRRLVFLGDYIDRGPDSAGVLALLREMQARDPDGVICLKGNHEDMLMSVIADPGRLRWWLMNGGDAALDSFGAKHIRDLPPDVVEWIAELPTAWEDERRSFVHAGLDPTRPRLDQDDQDRLWIREPFLEREHDFGKYVVHGHTPQRSGKPDIRRYRANLDTAAVYGGKLTAAIFGPDRDAPLGILQSP